MDDRFFNGLLGCSTKVCGYKVDSLTPWHNVLLSAIDSPILTATKDSDLDDLLIFLKVTQAQWPELPSFKKSMRDHFWKFRMRFAKTALLEMGKFKEWLSVQLSTPRLWQNEDDSTQAKSSCPNMLRLVLGLVNSSNISLHEAWNMRNSEAQWYNVCLAEINGAKLRVVDENEPMPEKTTFTKEEMLEKAKADLPPEQFKAFKQSLEMQKNK